MDVWSYVNVYAPTLIVILMLVWVADVLFLTVLFVRWLTRRWAALPYDYSCWYGRLCRRWRNYQCERSVTRVREPNQTVPQ